jgi:hypothetical protein
MIHALTYIVFILVFTTWLGYELKRDYSLRKHWRWIASAVAAGLVGSLIYNEFFPDKFGNFILHASGGVSAVLLFIYFTKTLKITFTNWRVTLVIVFAFVSTLGVLNELAEYFFELMGLGPFSFDNHDTWRDFVANTTGAAVAWMVYTLAVLRERRGRTVRATKPKSDSFLSRQG